MKNTNLLIAIAQINPTVGNILGNFNLIRSGVKQAIKDRADIVIFPEMAISGYPAEDLIFKHGFVEKCEQYIDKLKVLSHKITIIVGGPHRGEGNVQNVAFVLNGGQRFIQAKQLLPNYGVFDEKRYFIPGEEHESKLFILKGNVISLTICEDMWHKNGPTAMHAANGNIDLFINISASPFHLGKPFLRDDKVAGITAECPAPFVYCNLIGGQDELLFDGASFVYDGHSQQIVRQLKEFHTDYLLYLYKQHESHVKVISTGLPVVYLKDTTKNKSYSEPVYTGINGRLTDQVETLYEALVFGIKEYMSKVGFRSAILGLSGGIDSALVACLASAAIGSENVYAISMPTQYNTTETKNNAKTLASHLKLQFNEEHIGGIYEHMRQHMFSNDTVFDVSLENLQARIRGTILMTLSNRYGHLVLTTGNKSETAVGYCTLYGDTAGGFAPLKDVPKTMVYDLARYINRKKEIIPQGIINAAPSAELRPDQKDQDSLPPYELLDQIIFLYLEENFSAKQIAKGIGTSIKKVKEVIRLIDRAEYKRRQAPPGIKITSRAFGRDWRLPIINHYKG